ncbi:MAG: hypothetical protein RBS01_01750 [Candidatus Dojkabacteria bacterium]|jgi:hypothetical membrane protein|nr:hypothetical protein [Candidatus Dojkabacteria bacterium]
MLDLIGIIYFTLSTLSLLGIFPIGVYEFLDLREGYAISDYGYLFETGLYFSISAIITGLLCGLDAITNPIYKKVKKLTYNYHALAAFTLVGIGLFPLTGEIGWTTSRVFHWLFALSFLYVYPFTRLLIIRRFSKRLFKKLMTVFLGINVVGLLMVPIFGIKYVAYTEYLVWLGLLITITISSIFLSKKSKSL